MTCTEFLEMLQRRLDGEAIADRTAVDCHLAGCGECRAIFQASERLEDGLRLIPAIQPPAGLSSRIVAAALADRGRIQLRRRLRFAASALAASILASLLIAQAGSNAEDGSWIRRQFQQMAGWFGPQPTVPVTPISTVRPGTDSDDDLKNFAKESTPSLRANVSEVSSAVVALTRRTAGETIAPTRLLTEAIPAPVDVFDAIPASPEGPIAAAWQETGQRVTLGVEPVANSARRALNLFFREAPLPGVSQ
jgi:predicted anti-sigma-YlaC factor YlaD